MNINRFFLMLFMVLLVPFEGQAAGNIQNTPLMIQEQGSFAAGGTVIENPGVFNPRTPANPAGQTYHGDHAYVFYQKPVNARKYPWYSCMVRASSPKHGKAPRTDVKVSRTFFCAGGSVLTWWISLVAVTPDAA